MRAVLEKKVLWAETCVEKGKTSPCMSTSEVRCNVIYKGNKAWIERRVRNTIGDDKKLNLEQLVCVACEFPA